MDLKSYKVLLEETSVSGFKLTYQDKLLTTEWQNRRNQIVSRDNKCCSKCHEPKVISYGKGYREKTELEKDIYWNKVSKTPNFPNLITKDRLIYPKEPVDLHVHHKYYILNKLPWEYLDEALITLCDSCHRITHETETIPVYTDESKMKIISLTKCNNCNGLGYLSHYKYYKNGICFNCSGTGYLELK